MKDKKINSLIKLMPLIGKYKFKLVILIICILLSFIISMLWPIMSQQMIDKGFLNNNYNLIFIFATSIVALILFQQLIDIISTYYLSFVSANIKKELHRLTIKTLFNAKIKFFSNINQAELLSNISIDIENICVLFEKNVFFTLIQILKVIGGVIFLFIINYKLAGIILITIPIRYFLINQIGKKRKIWYKKFMDQTKEYSAWFGETIAGIREVKLWNIYNLKFEEFNKKQDSLVESNKSLAINNQINESIQFGLSNIIVNLIYILGAYSMMKNAITFGEIIAFITYSSYVNDPLALILNLKFKFINVGLSSKRLSELLETTDIESCGDRNLPNNFKKIEFKNVSFSYEDSLILKNINLEIKKGDKIGIVGPNGTGKSTLFNLLLRLYDVNDGNILIDGVDISEFKLDEYRNLFSSVFQDSYIFKDSIIDNILLSDITDNDIDVMKLMKALNLSINKKTLNENGNNLSSGQRQKILLIRALKKEGEILLLDEAYSNCDVKSINIFTKILFELYKDKTLLVITHSNEPSFLEKLDKIIVIENGQISGIGTHNQLIKNNMFYKRMMDILD